MAVGGGTGLLGSIERLFSTLIEVVQTRIELASNELEEERERLQEIVILGLVTAFLIGLGVVLLTIVLVMVFWQTHRMEVLAGFAAFYLVLGIIAGLRVLYVVRRKPRLFSATLSELDKDREQLSSRR
ncbi:MAG: phage holin family protein [Acidiferrobacteraceae bacterium]|jgi:uncharacterized membrane protein YqjE